MFLLPRTLHPSLCTQCRLHASIAAHQFLRTRARSKGFNEQPLLLRSLSSGRRYRNDEASAIARKHSATPISPTGAQTILQRAEQAALVARQRFGDGPLPEGFLSADEERVYVRLYGPPARDAEEDGTGVVDEGEDIEVEARGTGVLREVEGGGFEEVEFEVEGEEGFDEEEGGVVLTEGEGDGDVGVGAHGRRAADARLEEDIRLSQSNEYNAAPTEQDAEEGEEAATRTHPLTSHLRFTTLPSTLPLPLTTLINPITNHLSPTPPAHLRQTAHNTFGGLGLPYSTSTPAHGKTMQSLPIPLSAAQTSMSEMEADVFLACLIPGIYASVMAVLTETRKRLGTAWAEELVRKAEKGELRVLDAGGGGAGVLAFREMLRAEWERMREGEVSSELELAEADGRVGGMGVAPPLGHATVLTASDTLRKRGSALLEDTTFIPRLPDYVHASSAGAKREGKFDLVIAPHCLWGLREEWSRRETVGNFWGLVRGDGGVLCLLEKGVARGFEVVAGARQLLLDDFIESPPDTTTTSDSTDDEYPPFQPPPPSPDQKPKPPKAREKEKATILAPCPHHSACPVYEPKGVLKGRRDICHFSQRYVRPPFLQQILGARDKNWEDVQFSYLSVMRGRDLRSNSTTTSSSGTEAEEGEVGREVGEAANQRAFEGYEHLELSLLPESSLRTLSLSLPRAILPPLKRRGHVLLDLCTPSGTWERWTVPKSFSKQAFRDARKSGWGDLWGLGGKTRVGRGMRGRKVRRGDGGEVKVDMDVKLVKKGRGNNRARKEAKRRGVKEGRKRVEVG